MIGTSDGKVYEDEAHYHLEPHLPKGAQPEAEPKETNVKGVFLIRHGTTKLNAESGGVDKIRGWQDVPLSDKGKQDAEDIADTLEDSGIQVIHHSDLSRAAETAKAIADKTGAELVSTPKLRPWNVGSLTGTSSVEAHPQLAKYASKTPDEKVPEGESFNDFKTRAFEGLQEALDHAGNRKLALVTHHRVERVLNGWSDKGQPEDKSIDMDTFLSKGEPPGSAQIMPIHMNKR